MTRLLKNTSPGPLQESRIFKADKPNARELFANRQTTLVDNICNLCFAGLFFSSLKIDERNEPVGAGLCFLLLPHYLQRLQSKRT